MSWHSRRVAAEQPKTKRKPRLGLILRLAIYVPLLGLFGWRAWERFSIEREGADEIFRERVSAWLEHPPETITLPDGSALPMLTPEQAEAQGYELPEGFAEPEPGEPAEPPAE
jgi:hypothetical protein